MRNPINNQYPMQIEGLSVVATQYSAMLIDAWGVLHDGGSLYPGAKHCLNKLHELGLPVVVISNAARRAKTILTDIIEMGVNPKCITAVITSGEVFWQRTRSGSGVFSLIDKCVFYYGPERSRSVLEGLNLNITDDLTDAEMMITTGCLDRVDTLDDDLPVLKAAVEHNIPMICLNPDLVAVRSGVTGYSAGTIAQTYSDLGATNVSWVGKPYSDIYQSALALLPEGTATNVLAIGDAIRTDICGADRANLDSLFITGGIHHDEIGTASPDVMQQFFNTADARPSYYTKGLIW